MSPRLKWLGLLIAAALPNAGCGAGYEVIEGANWRGARQTDSLSYWPPAAFEQSVQGYAVLQCTAGPRQEALNCGVLSEYPTGWGFGDAALRTVPNLHATGVPAGTRFNIPVIFCFPEDAATCPQPPPPHRRAPPLVRSS